jgi:hypothetical protein
MRGLTIAVFAAACGSPPAPAEQCRPRDDMTPENARCVTTVRVHVEDDGAQPLANLDVTVCGNICLYGTTDAHGDARVVIDRFIAEPAVGLHGRATHTSYYQRFDGEGAVDVGTLVLHRWTGDAVPLASARAGPIDLEIPKDADVVLDLTLVTPEEKLLRARSIPLAEAPPFARVPGLASLVAIAPFGTSIAPGARVTLANDAHLAPGAAVDLFVHTTTFGDGPWAGFIRVASAHVSADGASIRSDDGQSIPELSWIGVVPK